VRIIAGAARGRGLQVPPGRELRPTPARVREALFSILAPEVAGASFLDLYAGTGAVGLEALSRGAVRSILVERAPAHLAALRANLENTRLRGGMVEAGDVLEVLDRLARRGERFDLLFVDPPYAAESERLACLGRLGKGDLLTQEARIVVETAARVPPDRVESLELTRECRYGDTRLSFYRWRSESPS
jgi:16S rRNA (guanine(966)-N(2))-methyltransferase RsmD